MNRLCASFMCLFLASGLLSAEPRPVEIGKAAESALASFAGTWDMVVVQPAGITKDATQLVFRKDWTYAALDKDGKELWGGTYELDPTAAPKIWDHRSHDAKAKGGDALGIYQLDGDTLKVCVVVGVWKDKKWEGKSRPIEFKIENSDAYLELRRAKSVK